MKKLLFTMFACIFISGCSGTFSGGGSGYSMSSEIPKQRTATGKKTFVFSPKALAWGVYDEEGSLVRTGRASGGVDACPENGKNCRTVTGSFKVARKGNMNCKSGKYPLGRGGAPMAYCMHFHKGFAIHGAPGVPERHSSHGCIRVTVADARWLNEDFLNVGSHVIVKSY